MIKKLIFILTFLVPFTLFAQEESKSTEQFLKDIDQKTSQLLHDFSIPGAAIAIIEDGEIVLQNCYGFSNKEKEIKVDLKTGFNIGSISKTIAAWGIMRLVHEGKIELDAPASKYLTRWHLPESEFDADEVTIRRLLSHTAGLSLHGYPGWSPKDKLPTIEESLNGKNNGPGRVEIIMEPGTKYKYSGGGYTILQLIIEEVTGQKFEDYIQTQILNPLGMTNSSYKIDNKIMAASSLEYNDYGDEIDFELFTAQAAAGLHTTLEDFTQLALASLYQNINREKYTSVLPDLLIRKMMKPVAEARGRFGYGMGYQVDFIQEALTRLSGHGGDNTGWHAIFRVNPITNDGFLALTNGGRGSIICYQLYCDWVNWKTGASLGDWCQVKAPIANKIKSIIDQKGIEGLTASYMDLKKNYPEKYDYEESQLNDLGYYYLGKNESEKATAIFKLNVDAFPYAFNTYDSYGEALLKQGAREEAIENYKQSVRLNPENENGIKVLQGLGESTENLVHKIPVEQFKLLEGEYLATHDESWRIVVEVEDEVLKCEDKYYKFTLVPIGDHKYVNPRFGALWRFETNDQDGKPMMRFGKHKFLKVNVLEKSKSVEQFINDLDKKIPQLLDDFIVPGAAIALIEDGEIVLQKGYGIANIEKGTKVDSKTGFNIGSISKSVAAWGVMKLVQEGKIELDAPAKKYLTRWQLPESEFDSDGVTVRRLLSHTAGLSLHSVSAGPPYDNLPTLEDWLLGKNDGLGRVEIILEPGSRYKYSGGGYGILQLIIEEVSGQTFEDYMQTHILDPLGMTNSSYKIDDNILAASASPYNNYGDLTDFELFTAQAGAGLHTTLEDLTRYAMASLYRHKDNSTYNPVLSPDIIQQMMEPVLENRGHWTYGMGYQTEQIGPSFVFSGHGGSNTGWQANFRVNPATNDGFVLLTNGGAGFSISNQVMCDWVYWKTGESLGNWCQVKPTIAHKLKQIIDSNGLNGLEAIYVDLKKDQANNINFSEGQLNDLGYYYKAKGDLEKAEAIFKINIDAFPNSFNVYDSYGEVLLAQGAREEAIKNYKKSVELFTGNGNGVNVLNELGISKEELTKSLSIDVDSQILAGYTGRFQNSTGATLTIQMYEGLLIAKEKEKQHNLVAESNARFQILGDESIVSFFTSSTGKEGLFYKERIWKKLSQTSPKQSYSTGNFLVFRNTSSWNRETDFEEVLTALGSQYKQHESSDMASLDLSPYDVIIIPGNQTGDDYYKDYVSNAERFDDYVAKGGILILELNNAERSSMTLPRGLTMVPHRGLVNAIVEPDHPIFIPFLGKRLIQANAASSGYFQNFPGDAIILAVETNGEDLLNDHPTFIEYSYGKGRVLAALQCFHDRDGSGRGPLMESVISYALTKSWTKD